MNYQDTSSLTGTDARSDTDAIPGGSQAPAVGNTITGSGTVSGAAGADVVGSAPGHVIAIQGAGGLDSSTSGEAMQVSGRYGVLNMDADGSYRYTRNGDTPDGVRDVFTYTLADAGNSRDSATLTIDIGREPTKVQENAQQVVPGPDGVVTLPAGVTLADIHVVGRNLVIDMPDGSQMVIVDGAVFVPQLVLGGVEVPSTNLAALLIDAEPQPAAGNPQSSGGNFGLPPGPLDPGIPLGDLIPPVEMGYTPPEFEDVGQYIDDEPEIFVQPDGQPASIAAVDDVNERGLPTRNEGEPAGSGEIADGNGSNNSDTRETTTGVILIDAKDTPATVTITVNGVTTVVTGTVPQVIQGQYGTLTLTSVSDTEIGYTYTLRDNTSGDNTHDDFLVTLTDSDGDQASATLRIDIIDDVPTARPDIDSIAAGEFGPATGNVITDAAAGDAGDSDTNAADTVGADNASVTSVSSVNVAANSDNTFSAGVLQVNGQYGVLTISANGDYSYTRNPNTPGGVTDTFNYTITDGDGDPSTTTLTINIADRPIIIGQNPVARTDDDAVPGANGNPGGPEDDTDAANLSGTLSGSGGDGTLTFDLLTTGAPSGFTYVDGPNGSILVQQVQNGSTVTVLTITVVASTGAYTVTQNAPILHPTLNDAAGDNTENNVSFTLNYTVTDLDNDSVNGTLQIDVDDDTPTASQTSISGTVDEDGVVEGTSNAGPGDGIAGGTGDVAGENVTVTGNFSSLFSAGADGPLTYQLVNAASLVALGLTSGGTALAYSISLVEGVYTLTATAGAGGYTVFTMTLNASSGAFNFTLVDQLDHASGDNENDLTVNLSSIIQATDRDGDSVGAGERALVITVDDDTPTASTALIGGTVDEDGVVEGTANAGPGDGIAGGTGDVAGEAVTASGNVGALFNTGADEPLTYSLVNAASLNALALRSGGTLLSYNISFDAATNVYTLTATAGAETVFTFTLNASSGAYVFTLVDQLDHASGDNENDLAIQLGGIIQATDRDGDSVGASVLANQGLVITVDDDTPTASTALIGGTVDEDGVVEGTANAGPGDGIAGGTGDVAGEAVTASGNVGALFNTGADEPLTYSLVNAASLNALALRSGGTLLSYNISFDAATNVYTLTATAGAETVFTFTLNASSGAYVFTLVDQLDHASGDNENDLAIQLGGIIQATDRDGDSVGASVLANQGLVITVDDDTPTASTALIGGTVDEDGVVEGTANAGPGDGIAGGTGDVAGEAVTASGNVGALFNTGADEPLTYSLVNAASLNALALRSGGTLLSYNISFDAATNVYTLTATAGAETVFTFTLNASSGAYVFTLVDQLDHASGDNENDLAIQLGGIIQATDRDGDSVGASVLANQGLVITVDDDTPTASTALIGGTVDEDGVVEGTANAGPGDGIAGGTGDVAGEAVTASGNVGALFNTGADEPLTYSLVNAASLNALALRSGGTLLSYNISFDAATNVYTLTATAGAETVFTFTLNASSGAYVFTLVDQLDHASGDNENDLAIQLGGIIQATDRDGDSVGASVLANQGLVITVDDDTPTASTALIGGTVDEDGVVEGTANAGPGDGIAGGTGDVAGEAVTASGNVGALFNTGADEPLTYSLVNAASLNALALRSGGTLLSYNISFDAATNVYTLTATAGAETVFTFTLNASSGAYVFTLVDQLDHASGDNENDLAIQLGGIIQATDRDGDSVGASVLANQGLVITVDDDTPTASTALIGGTVDEDGVVEGTANAGPGDGIAGGTGDVAGEAVTASGNVGALFNTGADEPLTYSLVNAASLNALALRSGGTLLSYNISFDAATNVYTLTATAGAETVFTFTLNASSGAYVFTLVDQLDHASGDNENDLAIQLGGIIQATDRDGDSVGASVLANQGLVITVDDDTPTASTALIGGTVDEDGVVEGTANAGPGDGIAGGTGDVAGEAVTASGNVGALFNTGADEPLTYSLVNAASLNALALRSGGTLLSYNISFDAATNVYTLTATAGAETVFTFTLNASSGAYVFTLVDQLDHASGDNENDLAIQLGGIIQATDRDGDSVGASVLANQGLVITVDDDTPTASTALIGGTVDEDGVVEGTANAGPGDGIAGGTGDVAGEAVTASGNVGALFNTGADEPLTYSLVNAASLNALALRSGGTLLSYNISFDAATNVYTLTATAGAETVFTFTLNASSGAYVFTLVDQLDHASGDNENDLAIQLGGIIQATDRDGDSVGASVLANQGLVITVDDDTPTASTALIGGTVDEDGVVEALPVGTIGDGIAGNGFGDISGPVTGDFGGEGTTASGNVGALFNTGADEPLTYSLVNAASLNALALRSGGTLLSYNISFDAATNVYTLTATAGAETVFTFTLNASSGAYVFTLVDQLDHASGAGENDLAIQLGGIIQATDRDGDSVGASVLANQGLVITVDDDAPVARNDTDAITAGGTSTDGNVITGVGTTSGAAGADSTGADAPAAITGLVGAVTSDTDAAGGFVAQGNYGQLTMGTDGQYNYVRSGSAPGNVSDTFVYSYTDRDGDTVTAQLVITIADSSPVLDPPPAMLLDDDDVNLAGGNPGVPANGDDVPTPATGQLVWTGGDGDVDFFFGPTQPALPTGFTFALVNASTATISQTGVGVVLTITLNNETGEYSVVQNAPIVHDSQNNTANDNTENNAGPFNIALVARDEGGTGDQSPAVNLSITVDDDTPVATATPLTGTVDEDGVIEDPTAGTQTGDGIAGGVSGDVPGQEVTATGSVTSLFSIGADKPGTYQLLDNFAGLTSQALRSGGTLLSYSVSFNAVTNLYTLTATAGPGGYTVFTFTLDASSGAYNFTLVDQLDHATGNQENDLTIQLGSIIQVTDHDGDSVTALSGAGQGLVITVDDDTPTATNVQLTGTVDEDGVVENAAPGIQTGDGIAAAAPGDVAGQVVTVTGSFGTLFNSGADEPLTYQLVNVASLNALALTSRGTTVTYQITFDIPSNTYTLTASANGGPVFTLTVNQASGAYNFTLFDQLDHPTQNGDPTFDNSENDLPINLSSIIQATDRDGDTVAAGSNALVITVDDDRPAFTTPATDSNLNPDTLTATGAIAFQIGADEWPAGTPLASFFDVDMSGTVDGDAITVTQQPTLVGVVGGIATFEFTFTYDHDNDPSTAAVENGGTVAFDLTNGGYTVTLDEGFTSTTIIPVSDVLSREGWNTVGSSASQYEYVISELDTENPIFVQFSAIKGPSNNTFGAGGDANYSAGETFTGPQSWASISNTENGVAGDTIQSTDILNIDFFDANPFLNSPPDTTPNPAADPITVEGLTLDLAKLQTGEDMVVLLKLVDANNPALTTTKIIIIPYSEIYTEGETHPLTGATIGNDIGFVIIENNDFNSGSENWVISGAQMIMSTQNIAGQGYVLNGAIGDDGATTQTLVNLGGTTVDSDVIKIVDIGLITTTTITQSVQLTFDVTATDYDGDTVTDQFVINPTVAPLAPLAAGMEAQYVKTASNDNSISLFSDTQQQLEMRSFGNAALFGAIAGAGLMSSSAMATVTTFNGTTMDSSLGDSFATAQVMDLRSVDFEAMSSQFLQQSLSIQSNELVNLDGIGSYEQPQIAQFVAGGSPVGAPGIDMAALSGGVEAAAYQAPSFAGFGGGDVNLGGIEAMIASQTLGGNAVAETGGIAQVLADALAGGGGVDIDGLLANLPGGGTVGNDYSNMLASHDVAAVSAWDMGAFGGFTDIHQAFTMESLLLHQDAVVQQA